LSFTNQQFYIGIREVSPDFDGSTHGFHQGLNRSQFDLLPLFGAGNGGLLYADLLGYVHLLKTVQLTQGL